MRRTTSLSRSRSATRRRPTPPSPRRGMWSRCELESNRVTANAIEPRAAIGEYHRGRATLHAPYHLAESARQPLAARRQRPEDPGDQAARDLARCRRRLRHEVRRLSGGWAGAVGVAPCRPAGEMDVDALGSVARRYPRPRSGRARGACARRPAARFWGCASTRCTRSVRTSSARPWSCRLFALKLAPGVYQMPALHAVGKGVFTNTGPRASLSRRRAAGGDLSDRAAARPRRRASSASIRSRSGGAISFRPPPCRTRPATGTTYDSGDFAHVMDECLKLADWNGFAQARRRSRRRTASCAAAASAISWKKPRCSTIAWSCASIRAAWSRSSPAPIRTARATPPSTRRW